MASIISIIRFLLISIVLFLLIPHYSCNEINCRDSPTINRVEKYKPTTGINSWQDMYNILPQTPGGIIFVGDSISRYCNWSELMGISIKNRAIPGRGLPHFKEVIAQIVSCRPDKLFINLGMCAGGSERDYCSEYLVKQGIIDYEIILNTVQKESPLTAIYAISVIPVLQSTNPSYIRTSDNDYIKIFNNLLRDLCLRKGVTYIDIHTDMLRGKEAKAEYHYIGDGIHPNSAGYLYMKTKLEKFMK